MRKTNFQGTLKNKKLDIKLLMNRVQVKEERKIVKKETIIRETSQEEIGKVV